MLLVKTNLHHSPEAFLSAKSDAEIPPRSKKLWLLKTKSAVLLLELKASWRLEMAFLIWADAGGTI